MCDGERNSRLKKSVEATANRTEGRGTKIGGSAPEPTVSPAPISDVAGIIRLFAQTILYVGAQLNTTSACWLSAAPSPVDGLHTMPHLRPPFCRSGCASG
jgi:hypothetical protein